MNGEIGLTLMETIPENSEEENPVRVREKRSENRSQRTEVGGQKSSDSDP